MGESVTLDPRDLVADESSVSLEPGELTLDSAPEKRTGPQLLAEEPASPPKPAATPPKKGAGLINLRAPQPTIRAKPPEPGEEFADSIDAARRGDLAPLHKVLQTPIIDPKEVSNALAPITPGPFAIHRGVAEAIAGFTSPEAVGITALTGGAADLAAAAGVTTQAGLAAAQTALSGYFATQIAGGVLKDVPEAVDAYEAGDYDKLLQLGGKDVVEGAFAVLGAKHAIDSAGNAVFSARTAIDDNFGPGRRFGAPLEPEVVKRDLRNPGPKRLGEPAPVQTIDLKPEDIEVVGPEPVKGAKQIEARPPKAAEPEGNAGPARPGYEEGAAIELPGEVAKAEPVELKPEELTVESPQKGDAVPSPAAEETPGEAPIVEKPAKTAPVELKPEEITPSEEPAAERPAKLAEAARVAKAPEPGTVQQLNVADIAKDPVRFQYKTGVGQGGVTDKLGDVEKFNPETAGVVAVWHDPADGKTYIVNGHHRLDLAERSGTKKINALYLDAADAKEARVKGALINIAEDQGSSVDAARVFRDSGLDEAGLKRNGIALKGKIASEGLALAKLDPHLFSQVLSGDIPPARAAVIGAGLPEHVDQRALYDVVAKADKAGKRPTNDQIGEMIRLATAPVEEGGAPTKTETQVSLFGEEEVKRSLIREKAEVSDYIRKQLGQEKRIFGAVGSEAAAANLARTGNVIKASENQAVADQATQALAVYDKLSARSGPVADALGAAASALAEGKHANETKAAAYTAVRAAILQELQARRPGVPGTEKLGEERTLQNGPGQRAPTEGPNAVAPQAFRFPFSRSRATVSDQARAVYRPARGATGRGVVYANHDAMQALQAAVGSGFAAVHLPPTSARHAIAELRRAKSSAATRIATALTLAKQADGSVAIVPIGSGEPLKKLKAINRHELFHQTQGRIGNSSYSGHLNETRTAELLAHPAAKVPVEKLLAAGYENKPGVLAMEIGAHLAGGPEHWAKLGINSLHAEILWDLYVDALMAQHGAGVLDQLTRITPRLNGVLRDARQFAARNSATETAGVRSELPGQGDQIAASKTSAETGPPARIDAAHPDEPAEKNKVGDLFGGEFNTEEQRAAEQKAQAKLEGDRLSAEFNSPVGRSGKLKRAKPPAQTDLFQASPDDEQGALFTLGLNNFVDQDARPALANAARGLAGVKDDALKLFAPAARGPQGKAMQGEIREQAAVLERKMDQARLALADASKELMKLPVDARFEFIDRIETGRPQGDLHLQQIADTMRDMLDAARLEVQQLGTGKLQSFYENYFPHMWKDPAQAQGVFQGFFAKKPFEGPKSFLKKRTLPTFADGLAKGLEPASEDPVELVIAKLGEMRKYIMAHTTLNMMKATKLARFVDAREGKAPAGWQKIEDAIGTVYGQSVQHIQEFPNAGIWQGLQDVADALGLKQERGFMNLGQAIGRANQSGRVQTKHGTAEDVLAHEIGHQIDWLAGSGKRFVTEYPDAATVARLRNAYKTLKDKASTPADRKGARGDLASLKGAIAKRREFGRQLRALADQRSGRKEYTHKREEKMALLAEMWVGSRELFERTAPDVFRLWKQFLNDNPKLHALRDIEGNTEVEGISQPYDVGGLVIKGHWWAPEQAARLLHNYLSPGLRGHASFRAYMGVGNVMLQFQLGWSAFHATFVSLEAMTSRFSLGVYQAAHGAPAAGLKSMAVGLTPVTPFSTYRAGKQIAEAWQRPGTQSPWAEQMADAVAAAGGRAHLPGAFQNQLSKQMVEAWRSGNWIGAGIRLPFALTEQAARPIMEYLVPRMKLGVFAQMAEFEIERLGGANAKPAELRAALQTAWDSVDNRMGQLVYDNLGWHRVVKDLAMASFRTVGWNVGDVRELGGGVVDLARSAKNKASGKPFDLSHRSSYIPSMITLVGLYGGLLYFLLNGKRPKTLLDYYYPKDGHGQRVSMPSYIKEVQHFVHDPVGTAKGKLHPLLTLAIDMLTNRDFFDRPIAKPTDSARKRWMARAKYLADAFTPISVKGFKQNKKEHPLQKALPFIGFPRAPKYVTAPKKKAAAR